jgi:hypothetical protein
MKRKSLTLSALTTMIMFALLLTIFAENSSANGPMPYTSDAVNKLNDAIDKIKVPRDTEADNDHKVKAYINSYKTIFSTVGYDYEQSIIKIVTDIKFNRYVVNRATVTLNRLAKQLLELHLRTGVNPRKYLNKECADLVIDYRNIVKKNMDKIGGC